MPSAEGQIESVDMITLVIDTCPFCVQAIAALNEAGFELSGVQASRPEELAEGLGEGQVHRQLQRWRDGRRDAAAHEREDQ